MKTALKSLMVAAAITAAAATASEAQIVVRARIGRPVERVVVRRPPPPSPRHVWVDEDWRVEHGRYVWHGGYWAAPPRERAVWVPGHWDRRPGGVIWVPGMWR